MRKTARFSTPAGELDIELIVPCDCQVTYVSNQRLFPATGGFPCLEEKAYCYVGPVGTAVFDGFNVLVRVAMSSLNAFAGLIDICAGHPQESGADFLCLVLPYRVGWKSQTNVMKHDSLQFRTALRKIKRQED